MTPAADTRPSWQPDLLSIQGLGHALSVSTRQVNRLLSAGKLPPASVNLSVSGSPKGRRWSRVVVLQFLESGRRDRP